MSKISKRQQRKRARQGAVKHSQAIRAERARLAAAAAEAEREAAIEAAIAQRQAAGDTGPAPETLTA